MDEPTALTFPMPRLGQEIGVELFVQRDDLLPFPWPSSKVRALEAELRAAPEETTVVITHGAVDSNHCRTLAFMTASSDVRCRLVLHGDRSSRASRRALDVYDDLGAETVVVDPASIGDALSELRLESFAAGDEMHVIAGGCHTPAAARAHRDAAVPVLRDLKPDAVVVASGTGAIQGGLVAAVAQLDLQTRVIGISIARPAERGTGPVRQAAGWAGAPDASIEFLDGYRDGGYGIWGASTASAVALGWRHGLPLDFTYTGKAFAAMRALAVGELDGSRVLFWHTGGIWNYMQQRAS